MCGWRRIASVSILSVTPLLLSAAPASQPTTLPATVPSNSPRLTQPWSKLTSLTQSQREQIARIHRKTLEEEKAVRQRENEAVMAVLTDAQKLELRQLLEKETVERKLRDAERRKKGKHAAGE